jgi:hypothetical protein
MTVDKIKKGIENMSINKKNFDNTIKRIELMIENNKKEKE